MRKAKKEKETKKQMRPNPFAGADDIYLTKNKIAATTTANASSKRGHTKVTKTKYYAQNASNIRLLKKAKGNTVRVGRTGTKYASL